MEEKSNDECWKDRLQIEHDELKERLVKLIEFMNSPKFFELSPSYRQVMNTQRVGMETYINALNVRLYEDADHTSGNAFPFGLLAAMMGLPTYTNTSDEKEKKKDLEVQS